MTTKEFRELRLKKKKTEVESLMLDYRYSLIAISEYLFTFNSGQSTKEYTLDRINSEISEILNEL